MTQTIAPPFYEVEPEEFDLIWDDIRPEIVRALATSNGEGTPEDCLEGLKAGRTKMLLFPSETAQFGVVIQFLNFPRMKIVRVLLAFGKNMRDVGHAIQEAEEWCRQQGCKAVEAWVATDSRVRLFSRIGYKRRYTIIRKELP
jgi:hypothetical protein